MAPVTRVLTHDSGKLKKINCSVRAYRACLVRAGAGGGAGWRSGPTAFLQPLPGTSGQHVAPITVPKACARLFLSTGWLGVGSGGVSFGRQPGAGEMAGRRGPSRVGLCPRARIPESSCAQGGREGLLWIPDPS